MKGLDRPESVYYPDVPGSYYLSEGDHQVEIDRLIPLEPDVLNAGLLKIGFERSAACCGKRQVNTESARIPANIERQNLGIAAVQRVQ